MSLNPTNKTYKFDYGNLIRVNTTHVQNCKMCSFEDMIMGALSGNKNILKHIDTNQTKSLVPIGLSGKAELMFNCLIIEEIINTVVRQLYCIGSNNHASYETFKKLEARIKIDLIENSSNPVSRLSELFTILIKIRNHVKHKIDYNVLNTYYQDLDLEFKNIFNKNLNTLTSVPLSLFNNSNQIYIKMDKKTRLLYIDYQNIPSMYYNYIRNSKLIIVIKFICNSLMNSGIIPLLLMRDDTDRVQKTAIAGDDWDNYIYCNLSFRIIIMYFYVQIFNKILTIASKINVTIGKNTSNREKIEKIYPSETKNTWEFNMNRLLNNIDYYVSGYTHDISYHIGHSNIQKVKSSYENLVGSQKNPNNRRNDFLGNTLNSYNTDEERLAYILYDIYTNDIV